MSLAELNSTELSDNRSLRASGATRCRWPWRWLLLVVFVGLQLADVVSTNYALAVPGVWEANPLMALSQAKLGTAWWLPKLAAIGLVVLTAPQSRRRWPMFFVVAISGGAVLLNLAHL
jgi:heme A synthase